MELLKFEKRVLEFVRKWDMLRVGEGVLIGVSGGGDSVALLRFFERIGQDLGIQIRCVHVEHGIRGEESLRDQRFVEELCRRIGVEETSYSVASEMKDAISGGVSLEEKAREARYGVLEKEAGNWEKTLGHPVRIAVAHHEDDNVETMLFHMIRGTGLDGMRGMPMQRGRIIRPFLGVSRQEIEEYLEALGQEYCQDSTNGDMQYDRNRIRHQVVPLLKQINPKAREHLGTEALLAGEVSDYIHCQAGVLLEKGKRGTEFCGQVLQGQPSFLCREVLHLWLGEFIPGAKDITAAHLEGMEHLLAGQTGKRMDLPYGLIVCRTYEGLEIRTQDAGGVRDEGCISFAQSDLSAGREMICKLGKTKVHLMVEDRDPAQDFPRKFYTKWFDYDKIKSTIQLRFRREGDFLTVTDQGGHKRLQDYFVNEKIPGPLRDQVPLLCEGHHVIWAIGYRISAYYKVDETTQRILKVQILEEQEDE